MLPGFLRRIVGIRSKLVWSLVSHKRLFAGETNPHTLRLLRKGVYETLISNDFGLAFSLFGR
jgi:hypothetical protein